MTWWALAWRALWRDARSTELRLLLAAVVLGVTALSSVAFLADRLQAGLQRDAAQLLGGDAVLVSDQAPAPEWLAQARQHGLSGLTTLSFPTMARADDAQGGLSRLVALKAVEPGYPLRGRLRVQAGEGGQAQNEGVETREVPALGEVWVEPALLEALDLHVGDALWLGRARLTVRQVLMHEPDRGAGFMNFAPRVLMHSGDLPATGLIQPASRVVWRLALTGPASAVRDYTAWVTSRLQDPGVRGVRLETLEAGRPEMRQTLDRASKFLHLVAVLAALLSAVAVALAARAFALRRLDDCAVYRVLGLRQRHMVWMYGLEFLWAGLLASAVGLALGWGLHHVFALLLSGLVETDLPAPGGWPVLQGLGTGLTLLVAFGLPPILQLVQVPPLRVIRREVGTPRAASLWVLGIGLLGFAALLVGFSRDLKLGAMVAGGFLAASGVFALLSWAAVRALRGLVREGQAPTWLLMATRQLAARPGLAVVQISALALGLLSLLLLVLLRTDLISSWRAATPERAPNRFVINIQPDQAAAFQQRLQDSGVHERDWYPMIRGRLVSVNGQTVTPASYEDERAQRLVDREFNLSHTAGLPSHNQVVAGQWTPQEAEGLSIEEGLAKTLHLSLGDRLVFDIAGQPHEARITSVRRVDWTSMRANFFVLFPLSQMPDLPATYITAFRAPARQGFDHELVRQFPNVTLVDMAATLNQVQRVLTQVSRAVEFLFVFTLAAGLVVVVATVTGTREARTRDYAVLRALGATRALLARVQRAELIGVGALAGALAAGVALILGWVLAHRVFEFDWTAPLWVPWVAVCGGALLAWAAGWWGLRGVLRRPVVRTLREASNG
jgi:putative ABC transport system permease protein